MVAYFGGFLLPVTGIGTVFGCAVYQASGSASWGAISALSSIIAMIVTIGVIFGKFSQRMDNFEEMFPIVIKNAILELKDELRETYQTKDGCSDVHTARGKGAGA